MKKGNSSQKVDSKNGPSKQGQTIRNGAGEKPAKARAELANAWETFLLANHTCRIANEAAGMLRSLATELFHIYQTLPHSLSRSGHDNELNTKVEKLADALDYAASARVGDALSHLIDLGVRGTVAATAVPAQSLDTRLDDIVIAILRTADGLSVPFETILKSIRLSMPGVKDSDVSQALAGWKNCGCAVGRADGWAFVAN